MKPTDHEARLIRLARFASGADEVVLAFGRSDRIVSETPGRRWPAVVERARAAAHALPDGRVHVLPGTEPGWIGLVDTRYLRRPILLLHAAAPLAVSDGVVNVAETVFDSLADAEAHGVAAARPEGCDAVLAGAAAGAEAMSGVGTWRVGLSDRRLVWSDETYRIYGLTPGTAAPSLEEALAHFPENVQGIVRQHLQRAIDEHSGFSFVLPFVRRDGVHRTVRCMGYVASDEEGVDQLCGILQDVTEEREAQLRLWTAANHDALTGLPNRALWQERLTAALAAARKDGHPVALILADLDQFKAINDLHGHEAGDEALRAVARRLGGHTRFGDTLARLGGDEFAILITDIATPEDLKRVLARLAATAEVPFSYRGATITARLSFGAAFYPRDAADAQELYRNADLALFRTKAEPERRSTIYDPRFLLEHEGRARRARELRAAILGAAIVPYYSPVVEIASGRIAGIEAGPRWRDGDRLNAVAALPAVAEDSELAPLAALAMIDRVRRDAAAVRAAFGTTLPVTLALSRRQLESDRVLKALSDFVADGVVPPRDLTLEVDGDPLAHLCREGRLALMELGKHGVGIGHASLVAGVSSLVAPGPLKVRQIRVPWGELAGDASPAVAPLVRGIVEAARAGGVRLVATGIADAAQAARVARLGVAYGEGPHWCEPLPVSELVPALGTADA